MQAGSREQKAGKGNAVMGRVIGVCTVLLMWLGGWSSALAFSSSESPPYTLKLDGDGEQIIYESVADDEGNQYLVGAYNYASQNDNKPGGVLQTFRDDAAAVTPRPTASSLNLPQSAGGFDLFIAKLDALGNRVWVKTLGGPGNDAATGAAFDRLSGKVFVSGYITGSTSGTLGVERWATASAGIDAASTTNLFITQVNPDGSLATFETMPLISADTTSTIANLAIVTGDDRTTSPMHLQGHSLALAYDFNGNSTSPIALYIKGEIAHAADVSGARIGVKVGQHYGVDSTAGRWAFVSKVIYRQNPAVGESHWNWEWMKPVSVIRTAADSSSITQLKTDPALGLQSPVFVGGYWTGNLHNGIGARSAMGNYSGFVEKLQATDGELNYQVTIAGDSMITALVVNDDGDLMVAGGVARENEAQADVTLLSAPGGANVTVDPGWRSHPNLSSHYKHQAVIAKIDTQGVWQWATLLGGYYSSVLDLKKGSDGQFFITGGVGKDTTFLNLPPTLGDLSPGKLSVDNRIDTISVAEIFADYAVTAKGAATSSSVFSQSWYDATLSCPAGSTLLNGKCYSACPATYTASGDRCIRAANSYTTPANNSCGAGYDLINSYCYDTCDPDVPWLWDNTQCWDGEFSYSRDRICPGQQSGGVCYPGCNAGYARSGNICSIPASNIARSFTQATAGCMAGYNCSIELADSSVRIEFLRNGTVFGATMVDSRERGKADYTSLNERTLVNYLDTDFSPNPKLIAANSVDGLNSELLWNDEWQLRFIHNGALTDTDYQLTGQLDITFNFADGSGHTNHTLLNLNGLAVNRDTGSVVMDVPFPPDFVEPELVPDSYAYVARFHEENNAATFDWLQVSDAVDTHGSLLMLSNLQTLYLFGGRGHYPTLGIQLGSADFAHRDSTGPDSLLSSGSLMYAVNPDSGAFLPTFLHYFDFLVGSRIAPPVDGVEDQNVISLRRNVGSTSLIGGGGAAYKPLLQAPRDQALYTAGPLRHAILLWPTQATVTDTAQPLTGKAVRVRWPSVAEGLQEYMYSTDAVVTLPQQKLNGGGNSRHFHWIQYAQKASDGALATSGIHYNETSQALETSADRFASLVFFDGIDPTQSDPSILSVRSYAWHDATRLTSGVSAPIGTTLTPPADATSAKTGYVMTERARYDADPQVYARATRSGQIIPVNVNGTTQDKTLIVAWYQAGQFGLDWPLLTNSYGPSWPQTHDQIVVVSQQGSGGLNDQGEQQSTEGFDAVLNQPKLYVQNDANLPGFNPNEEHARLYAGPQLGYFTAYALRKDLNSAATSEPYVLVRYRDPALELWKYRVYPVHYANTPYTDFTLSAAVAGNAVTAPYPLNQPELVSTETVGSGDAYWLDKDGQVWARSNGSDSITVQYHYRLLDDFWYDQNGDGVRDTVSDVGWFDGDGQQISLSIDSEWPAIVPEIAIGETLIDARDGLPGVRNMQDLTVVYDQNDTIDPEQPGSATRATAASVRLFDFSEKIAAELPAGVTSWEFTGTRLKLNGDVPISVPARLDPASGDYYFPDLSSDLRYRLYFNPYLGSSEPLGRFYFKGGDFNAETGQPANGGDAVMHLTNVMTQKELDQLGQIDKQENSLWDHAMAALFQKTRNPNEVDADNNGQPDGGLLIGLASVSSDPSLLKHAIVRGEAALSTAFASEAGYVVLAENALDDPDNTSPVNLHVIKVVDHKADGSLHVIRNADNALDPRLVVRQDLDFGGRADELTFQWWWLADVSGEPDIQIDPVSSTPVSTSGTWQKLAEGPGLNAYTLASGLPVLADGWVLSRYRGLATPGDAPGQPNWSQFSGYRSTVAGEIHAVATSGWVRRVMEGINPFEQRYQNFHDHEVDTYTSMLAQAGTRFEGDVALSTENDNLNQVGLIELYQTILNRASALSIDASNPIENEPAVNKQLLLAASRIADFYLLLGNEAYSDAMDPTVGAQTSSAGIGYLAPTLFAFKDQLPSLLDEELALLRGADRTYSAPVYNRLPWNFSSGADGEATYVQVYGISDTNGDGALNDASTLYPQGHGDAWGYYLTALKQFYALARHPHYDWQPLTDTTSIAGINIQVDYKDEERFARAAAAKARTGARIVDLTFREQYSHSAAGQWQGYKDTDAQRAWGMDEWARRAGQGAVLDWALGNALLPSSSDAQSGVARIDRQTVSQLAEIPAALMDIDSIVTRADSGSNPFGLDTDAIAFDIDPTALASGETHFDQIYSRAVKASTNALKLFDYANDLSQRIRSNQLTTVDLQRQVDQQELDYKSRLIELFGYPYAGEIGSGKLYPSDYNGPDLYHFMYIDGPLNPLPSSALATLAIDFDAFIKDATDDGIDATGSLLFPKDVTDPSTSPQYFNVSDAAQLTVSFPYNAQADYAFTAPSDWGSRRAPGKIQQQLGEMQLIQARINTANAKHAALVGKVTDHMKLIETIYNIRKENIQVFDSETSGFIAASTFAVTMERVGEILEKNAGMFMNTTKAVSEAPPKVVGFATDVTSVARAAIQMGGVAAASIVSNVASVITRTIAIPSRIAQDVINYKGRYVIAKSGFPVELVKELTVLEDLMRDELVLRANAIELQQEMANAVGAYQQLVAQGLRLMEQRELFRRDIASRTTDQRYQDITFRVFRNDALQKYRASFDLAARYTYLAAKAFDYETGLLSDDSSDQSFFESLVQQRTLGYFAGGTTPVDGFEGLSTPLARMRTTFDSVKGSYGFYSPLNEQMAFSLRREAMRIGFSPVSATQAAWQEKLQSGRVVDLWQVPEFRRFCRPPRAESAGPIPGLVLRFSTMIDFGRNLFGWPLGPGDYAYDSSRAATKFRSVGLHFDNYPLDLLAASPRAYLVPAGSDILRSPSQTGALREYRVLDQAIPVPTNLVQGSTSYESEGWIPGHDGESWTNLRRFSQLPVDIASSLDFGDVNTDTRLVGRSVWNTDWLLIIPGNSLLSDGDEGLNRLINGNTSIVGSNGISDVRIYFDTYSTSGE